MVEKETKSTLQPLEDDQTLTGVPLDTLKKYGKEIGHVKLASKLGLTLSTLSEDEIYTLWFSRNPTVGDVDEILRYHDEQLADQFKYDFSSDFSLSKITSSDTGE